MSLADDGLMQTQHSNANQQNMDTRNMESHFRRSGTDEKEFSLKLEDMLVSEVATALTDDCTAIRKPGRTTDSAGNRIVSPAMVEAAHTVLSWATEEAVSPTLVGGDVESWVRLY